MKVNMRTFIAASFLAVTMAVQAFAVTAPPNPPQAPTPRRGELPFSLTISGGISLGSYEAGVNWALLEYMRSKQQDGIAGKTPKLTVVTGASAGAINAVLSAMLWCVDKNKVAQLEDSLAADGLLPEKKINVDNNVLREAWVAVGIDDLMPQDRKRYDRCDNPKSVSAIFGEKLVDEMFARSAFDHSIELIRALMNANIFTPGQQVKIALLATRETPTEIAVGNIKVKSQRHVFVLTFRTSDDGRGHFLTEVPVQDLRSQGTVAYLLGTLTQDGMREIDRNDVIQLMYASSAFPLAFGKVGLTYCTDKQENGVRDDNVCPSGYFKTSAEFVDGGMFDNIPLGAAEALVDDAANNYFFFISPSTKRKVVAPFNDPPKTKTQTFGLYGMLGFLPGFIDSASDHELYTELRDGSWQSYNCEGPTCNVANKKLVMIDRYFPITGAYLGHFGAFLDRPFREFDYSAGVYDAVHDLATFVGHLERTQKNVAKTRDDLGLTKQGPAAEVFDLISTQEHQMTNPDRQSTSEEMHIIFTSITETPNAPVTDDGMVTFNRFVKRLHANGYIKVGEHTDVLRWIDKKYDEDFTVWYAPLVGRATKRLQMLQDKESDTKGNDGLRILAGGVSLGLGRFFDYDDTFRFQPTSVPASESWAYNLYPYEIGIDAANGGLSMSYLARLNIGSKHESIDLKLTPAAYNKSADNRVGYSQVDLYLAANRWKQQWSFGFGPTISYFWNDANEHHDVSYGAALYSEWFQTIRLTVGNRDATADKFFGHDWYVTLGFADIPGIAYRLNKCWQKGKSQDSSLSARGSWTSGPDPAQ